MTGAAFELPSRGTARPRGKLCAERPGTRPGLVVAGTMRPEIVASGPVPSVRVAAALLATVRG